MQDEAFEKLNKKETESVLKDLNPQFDSIQFESEETVIMGIVMPFYNGYKFLDIADHTHMPPAHRYAVYRAGDGNVIDFNRDTIYTLNEKIGISLSNDNVADYVRFFFTNVRGKHGRFFIVENIDDIRWRDDPPPASRRTISNMITPVTLKNMDENGIYHLEACMMFKDALIKGEVQITPGGHVTLENEEILIEDLSVADDILGQ